jgi:hypothetical protein
MHGDGDRWAQVSLRSGCDPWTSTAGLHASKGRVWAGTGVEGAGNPVRVKQIAAAAQEWRRVSLRCGERRLALYTSGWLSRFRPSVLWLQFRPPYFFSCLPRLPSAPRPHHPVTNYPATESNRKSWLSTRSFPRSPAATRSRPRPRHAMRL